MARAESKFSPKAGIESKIKARLEAMRNSKKKNPPMPNSSLSDYVYSEMPDNGVWRRRHYGDYRDTDKSGNDRSRGMVGVEEYFFKDPETGEFVREMPINDKALIAKFSNMTDEDLDKLKRIRASMIMPIPYYNEELDEWRYQLPLANTTPLPRMRSQLVFPFDGTMADYYEAWQKMIRDDPAVSMTKIPAERFLEPMYRRKLIDGNGNLVTNDLAYDEYGNFREGYADDILRAVSEENALRGDAGTLLSESDLSNAAKITKKLYDMGIPLKFIEGINDVKDKQRLLRVLNNVKQNVDVIDAINKNAVRNGFNSDEYLDKQSSAIEQEVKNKLYEELISDGFDDDYINDYLNSVDLNDFVDTVLSNEDVEKIKNSIEKNSGVLSYLNLDELADELDENSENVRLAEELNRQKAERKKFDENLDKFYNRTVNQKAKKVDNYEKKRLIEDLKALYSRQEQIGLQADELDALEDKIYSEAKVDRKTRQFVFTDEQLAQLDKIAEAREILNTQDAVKDKIESMPDFVNSKNTSAGGWKKVKNKSDEETANVAKIKKQVTSNDLYDIYDLAAKIKEEIKNVEGEGEGSEAERARLTEIYNDVMSKYEAAKAEYDAGQNQDVDNDGVVTDDDKKEIEHNVDKSEQNAKPKFDLNSEPKRPHKSRVFTADDIKNDRPKNKNDAPSREYLDRLSHIKKVFSDKAKVQVPNYTNKPTKKFSDGSNNDDAQLLKKNETSQFEKIKNDIDEANTQPDKKKRIVVLRKKLADKNKINSSENAVDDIRREVNKQVAKKINSSDDENLVNAVDTNDDGYASEEEINAIINSYYDRNKAFVDEDDL